MPWKGEKDPYKIWLSEIILQQTRVEQGWKYYTKFIRHYPTVIQLANALDDDVFKLWEGLGYYSRCKNLLAAARSIAKNNDGNFPEQYETIIQLKGVGPYTASAIASFAFNLPHAVVDGNVYRVLARYFGVTVPSDTTEGKRLFHDLAHNCMDRQEPGVYNQAIMDFGATVCTPANPLCTSCPLMTTCTALEKGLVGLLPVKIKSLQRRTRWFTYFIIELQNEILLRKRTGDDIWQNLHEFFLDENEEQKNWDDASIHEFYGKMFRMPPEILEKSGIFIQKLTHQTIHSQFIHARVGPDFLAPPGYFFLPEKALGKLAFPKTITKYLDYHKKINPQTE